MNHRACFATLGLIVGLASSSPGAEKTVWLSDLNLNYMRQGYDTPKVNLSITKKPISIAGKAYEKGVGTHARSTLWVTLDGGSTRFQAAAGLDDSSLNSAGSVTFKVVGDGKTLWESGLVRPGQAAREVDVDVKGVKSLLLIVDDAKDGIAFDHADWADARFLVTGTPPVATAGPQEEAVILTPKPGPAPRINGAKVFGVRPGSPLLFTIPATGERPITFAARGLPEGLTLDPATGRIAGTISKAGDYPVTIEASNARGKATSPLKLVCGETLALTPHLGWNSWYIWEGHVTDKIMRDAADAMIRTDLINHGFMYVNIDDCWAIKPGSKEAGLDGSPRDERGRVRCNDRFPDMKALTDYIHSKGLKAGIYTSPGRLTCGGHVGALGHEEDDAKQFVEWGFDFLKYDWCSYGEVAPKPDLEALELPYRKMSEILRKQPRDVVFNLCQYGMGDVWKWGKQVGGHSWRTAGDLGGSFEGIPAGLFRDGFDLYTQRELHKYGGPGGWNDPDYILIGYLSNWRGQTVPTPLSPNEQYTHVSLWSLVAAPLILSGDITRLDDFTLSLLSNDEVIDVDQDALGRPGRRMARDDAADTEVWMRELEDGTKAVGLFNRGEFPASVTARWADLGVSGKQIVRDLWRQADVGQSSESYTVTVPRHGAVMVRLKPAQ